MGPFERVASSFLLAARQLDALAPAETRTHSRRRKDDENPLFALEDALGIAQHHDAISGTAKQHVADDYSKHLSDGMNSAALHVVQALKKLMLGDGPQAPSPLDNLSYCPLLNETVCQVSEVSLCVSVS